MKLRARILSQGDEILAGRTLDTNAHRLAGLLTRWGVDVQGIAAAPDDLGALEALFRHAGEDCDLIVSSGGLGPTEDDHSADAVAAAMGVEVALNEVALDQVKARYASFGVTMPASNRRQAILPADCEILENHRGTAPGFAVTIGRARAFFFPGVPRELDRMVADHLEPWLEARGLRPPLHTTFHVCGVGESNLQDRLGPLPLPPGVRLGFKTWIPFNTVLLYADTALPDAAERLEQGAAMVRTELGVDTYGSGETTFPMALGELQMRRGLTLGTAESCTGGGAGRIITQAAGSSRWYLGSVVSYANSVKTGVLGVPEEVLAEHGAVSEATAEAMALGAKRVLGTDVAVSITGIAGPGGGSADKPVGMVCFGMALPDGSVRSRTVQYGKRGRELVRDLAAANVLEWLRRRLVKMPVSP